MAAKKTGKNKPGLSPALKKKEERLRKRLEHLGRVLIAFSGGVDSTLLLFEAVAALGADRVTAVTAVGDVYPPHERERARTLCERFKVEHRLLETAPLRSKAFCLNDKDRCYHCKGRLFDRLEVLARKMGVEAILEASQADDRADFRPGARAVAERGALSPLQEAGLGKEEVRRLSRHHGLPTADLPAAACLASRVPYGTRITGSLLQRISEAEDAIRKLGFRQFRLRHHGPTARLEFDPREMERAFKMRRALANRIAAAGWTYASIDLRGYRQGSLNESLDGLAPRTG